MLEQEHAQDHSGGRPEPPAPAAQVPAAEGGGDELDQLVIVQNLVDRPELVIPQLVTVGPQHLEDTALRMRATDYGASMEIERVQCAVGRSTSITCDDGAARELTSRKLSTLPRTRRRSPRQPRVSAVRFAPGSS
jgi:hypothetical protein